MPRCLLADDLDVVLGLAELRDSTPRDLVVLVAVTPEYVMQQEAEQLVVDVVGERGADATRVDVQVRAVPGPPAADVLRGPHILETP